MKTVLIDFDGVLARYDGTFSELVLGEPNPGALEAVAEYVAAGFRVVVFTTRAKDLDNKLRVAAWLAEHGFLSAKIDVTAFKVPAVVYIDDRAICFKGKWPSAQWIEEFRPWWDKR